MRKVLFAFGALVLMSGFASAAPVLTKKIYPTARQAAIAEGARRFDASPQFAEPAIGGKDVAAKRLSVKGKATTYNIQYNTHMEDGTYATTVKVMKLGPADYRAVKSNQKISEFGGP